MASGQGRGDGAHRAVRRARDAHAALELYLHENGLAAGGPAREIYVTDPGEVPDPAQWKTQIVWPLAQ